MQIIGTTTEGLLISATHDEVARLAGYYSKYTTGVVDLLKPGCQINVNEMFQKLYDLASQEKELAEAAAKLRVCADTITLTAPLIPKIEPKKS